MILKWSACGLEGREPRTEGREELDISRGMVARLQGLATQHEDGTLTP